jgi:hypothetical protein
MTSPFGFASDLYHRAGNWVDHRLDDAQQLADRPFHAVEHAVDSATHAAARAVNGVPLLGSLANAEASVYSQVAQVPGAIANQALRAGTGLVSTVAHPVESLRGVERLAEGTILPPSLALRGIRHGYDALTGQESVHDALNHTLNPVQVARDAVNVRENLLLGHREANGERQGGMIDPMRRAAQAAAQGRYGEAWGRMNVGAYEMAGLANDVVENAAPSLAEHIAPASTLERVAEAAHTTTEQLSHGHEADDGNEHPAGH